MRTNPKTEQELSAKGLLPKGEYSFEVMAASNGKSKKGNDMIKLQLRVFPADPDAKPRILFDYLLAAMEFKLKHFCQVAGVVEAYESDELDAQDCVNADGKLFIDIEPGQGSYAAKNVVKDYVVKTAPKAEQPSAVFPQPKSRPTTAEDMADQDIPF